MKKIIAILLALALVSTAAFAQWLNVSNTLSTNPTIIVDGGQKNWKFDPVLEDMVSGFGATTDGRAQIGGQYGVKLTWVDRDNANLLAPTPRWKIGQTDGWKLQFGALLLPIDHLEVHIGNHWVAGKSVAGPGIKWVGCEWAGSPSGDASLASYGAVSNGMSNGLFVGYKLLDDNLWLGAGVVATDQDRSTTWIKKGAYGPFQAGVNFKVSDDVSFGARWEGRFGGYDAKASSTDNGQLGTGATDKKYQKHGFYVGANLDMFKDAKVGTTIGVGFSFNTEKECKFMGGKPWAAAEPVKKNTMFAGTVAVGFDFQNAIKDDVWVTVGWRNYDGKKTKVLPFAVGNTLKYSVSEDATFTLDTQYARGSLVTPKKSYNDGDILGTKDKDFIAGLNGTAAFGSVVHIKPNFEFKLGGKHTFAFGVETDVFNITQYFKKNATDWAYTTTKGLAAKVAMPISWTYSF